MDSRKSTRELAKELALSQTTVWDRLKAFEKILKAGKSVSHKFSEINIANLLNTYVLLMQKKKEELFWKNRYWR